MAHDPIAHIREGHRSEQQYGRASTISWPRCAALHGTIQSPAAYAHARILDYYDPSLQTWNTLHTSFQPCFILPYWVLHCPILYSASVSRTTDSMLRFARLRLYLYHTPFPFLLQIGEERRGEERRGEEKRGDKSALAA